MAAAAGRTLRDEEWAGGALGEGPAGIALRERRTVSAGEGQPGFSPQAPEARTALAVPILSGARWRPYSTSRGTGRWLSTAGR